jgi:hypothetical protein
MRQIEIVAGGIYRGRGGRERTVVAVYRSKADGTMRVSWRRHPSDEHAPVFNSTLKNFARWAKIRIDLDRIDIRANTEPSGEQT